MPMFPNPSTAVMSPCIGVCRIAPDGFCDGCHRSLNEIANWSAYSPEQRLRLMNDVLPQRAEQRLS